MIQFQHFISADFDARIIKILDRVSSLKFTKINCDDFVNPSPDLPTTFCSTAGEYLAKVSGDYNNTTNFLLKT